MKNTRQKICTTIRDLKLYLVDLLSVRAQKIKSTQDQSYTIYILAWSELLIFYLLLSPAHVIHQFLIEASSWKI